MERPNFSIRLGPCHGCIRSRIQLEMEVCVGIPDLVPIAEPIGMWVNQSGRGIDAYCTRIEGSRDAKL